jgi:hypothetical protein
VENNSVGKVWKTIRRGKKIVKKCGKKSIGKAWKISRKNAKKNS